MSSHPLETSRPIELRARARVRLTGHDDGSGAPVSASAALGVLHDLASSPATAANALALLHELQVHQVELDLQAEEASITRADLESDLQRQRQIYDAVPVSLFTIEAGTAIREVNATGVRLLGEDREALIGQPLDRLLAAHSARTLHAMLERVRAGSAVASGSLELPGRNGEPRVVQTSVTADPAGQGFLVAALDLRGA